MTKRDNLLGVFATVYKWRKAIRNFCLAALVLSIGLSLLLDNYYKAVTVFYPSSPELANPELIFGYTSQVTEYFGSDRDLDRLAEIANSNEVVDFIVKQFNLYEHYGIDPNSVEGPHKVRKRFRSLYAALKNKNDAIELSIEDKDPKIAATIANATRDKINEIGQRLIKNSQLTLMATFEDNIKRKTKELEVLGDSLHFLKDKYNIQDLGQGEKLSELLTTAESKVIRNRAKLKVLENNPDIPRDTITYIKADLSAYEEERRSLLSSNDGLDKTTISQFNQGYPIVSVISDLHFQARKQMSYDVERYNQIKAAYNTVIPSLQLVEAAETPLIKSRPTRSIIVIASLIAALLFSILGALFTESYRNIDWKEVTSSQ